MFVSFFFFWHLLIYENTLIQVVKLKKPNPTRRLVNPAISPLGHERILISSNVNFTTFFFLRDKLLINMKMLGFFLAKCVRTAVKTMVVDR